MFRERTSILTETGNVLNEKFLEDGWGGEVEIMPGTFKMASFYIKLTIYKNKNEIIIIILISYFPLARC